MNEMSPVYYIRIQSPWSHSACAFHELIGDKMAGCYEKHTEYKNVLYGAIQSFWHVETHGACTKECASKHLVINSLQLTSWRDSFWRS